MSWKTPKIKTFGVYIWSLDGHALHLDPYYVALVSDICSPRVPVLSLFLISKWLFFHVSLTVRQFNLQVQLTVLLNSTSSTCSENVKLKYTDLNMLYKLCKGSYSNYQPRCHLYCVSFVDRSWVIHQDLTCTSIVDSKVLFGTLWTEHSRSFMSTYRLCTTKERKYPF